MHRSRFARGLPAPFQKLTEGPRKRNKVSRPLDIEQPFYYHRGGVGATGRNILAQSDVSMSRETLLTLLVAGTAAAVVKTARVCRPAIAVRIESRGFELAPAEATPQAARRCAPPGSDAHATPHYMLDAHHRASGCIAQVDFVVVPLPERNGGLARPQASRPG
jgi:hypothetical protein